MTNPDTDPVTVEIFRNRVDSIAEEMIAALVHTAYSTNIKDRQDASCAIYTADGEMISQAARASPTHTGTMKFTVDQVTDKFDPANMAPGDVYAYNTPYPVGPHHLNDVAAVAPVFHDDEVVAYTASQAHHVDVGGMEPGSMPFGATEIYQEGLQIPAVRLFEAGEVVDDVWDLLTQNVRTGRVTEGDLWAQQAAANTADGRLEELIASEGIEDVRRHVEAVIDYAERRMRRSIDETLPDGTYAFEDVVEGDSIDDNHIRIHVELTVDGGELTIDFTKSNDQVRGPMNYTPSAVIACVNFAIQAIVDPRMPTNAGTIRPLEVVTRPGSILDPEYPAPVCSGGMVTSQRIVDVIFGALQDAVPERVTAACSGTKNNVNIGGVNPDTDEFFTYVETYGGGQGAMTDLDGMDGVHTHMTNTHNAPAEVLEHAYPFVIEGYSLVEDSEGAGRQRGGLGLRRDIRFLLDEVRITLNSDRREVTPWGVDGGHNARGSKCRIVHTDGSIEQMPSKFSARLEDHGARMITETPGGGGWGDPMERNPERVEADVRAGLISRDRARSVYGVAITEAGTVDAAETAVLRNDEG